MDQFAGPATAEVRLLFQVPILPGFRNRYRVAADGEYSMQDMRTQLESLRTGAAECALIRDLATDPTKRELFTRLAEHLSTLAREVEAAIASQHEG